MATQLKLLVVEDSPDDAELILAELRRAGFDPQWQRVETRADFLAEIKNSPDIILSDYSMPLFSGLHAVALLRDSGLDIPFILISGTVGEDTAVEAMKQGAADYLLKDRLTRLGQAVEHALAEKKLRDERKQAGIVVNRLAAIVESSDDAIVGKGLDGIVNSWNKGAERIFGHTAAEMVGASILRLIPADRHLEEKGILARIKRGESLKHFETLRLTKDGRLIDVSVTISPIKDGAGKIIGISKVARDITARRQAEAELRLLNSAVEQSRESILITDAELELPGPRIIFVNPAFTQMTGYTAAEVIGKTPRILQGPHTDKAVLRRLRQKLQRGEVFDGEAIQYRKDGTEYHQEWQIVPIRNASGQITHFVAAQRDISARKQVEEQMRLQLSALTAADNTIIITSRTGKIEWVNPAFTKLTGYSAAEAIGHAPRILKSGQHPPEFYAAMWQTILAGNVWQGEIVNQRKDGSRYTEEMTVTPVRDAGGAISHFVAIKQDITDRKRLEEEARQRTTLFEAQVDSSIDGILVVDGQGKKILQNLRLNDLLKIPPHIATDKDDRKQVEFVTGQMKEPQKFTEKVAHLYAHPEEVSRDELELRDGTILDRYTSPVRDRAGNYYGRIWVFRDLTQQRNLEAQYRQAQKMESIGQLAGGIAHDFNNILGAIMGYTDLARAELAKDTFEMECLDQIAKASRRAVDLVRQILAFSRQQEHERKPTQLKYVLEEALKLLRASVSTTIEFKTNLTKVPTVLADATAVHQVIMNLGTNAWHAMKNQPGILSVELFAMDVDEDFAANHPDLHRGRYVCLTVGDTGCGMDRETLGRIFEPFFTTKATGEGTGLGLSVVHGIMKSHEGGITVHSQPGQGTVFHLYFPAIAGTAVEASPQAAPVPRGNGERILFVDDEEPLAMLGKRVLEKLGYIVTIKTNPLEAISAFREQPGQFDLVMTDYNMPVMDGIQFAAELLKLQPGLPIILASGYRGTLTDEKVCELGFRELLLKPNTTQTLGEAVHRVLHPAAPV